MAAKAFDAVSDAYNSATDQVSFVANTVIDTVEMAMAILTQGFDFGASCPISDSPSVDANPDRVKINFGRQKCQATLVGQTITLFDFNFGELWQQFSGTAMLSFCGIIKAYACRCALWVDDLKRSAVAVRIRSPNRQQSE